MYLVILYAAYLALCHCLRCTNIISNHVTPLLIPCMCSSCRYYVLFSTVIIAAVYYSFTVYAALTNECSCSYLFFQNINNFLFVFLTLNNGTNTFLTAENCLAQLIELIAETSLSMLCHSGQKLL